MEPVTIALLLGSALLLGAKKKGSRKSSLKIAYDQKMTHEQRVAMMIEIRKMSAYTSSRFGMTPYLADFLTVVGYKESRFNPSKANPEIKVKGKYKNAARGLFQLRPNSAFTGGNTLIGLRENPNILFHPVMNFCAAVDYAMRLDAHSSRESDWMAIARGWRKLSLVNDYDQSDPESSDVANRFFKAVRGVNKEYGADINEDFVWMPVQRGGYPGVRTLLSAFGVKA